jgi:hypothetical protein
MLGRPCYPAIKMISMTVLYNPAAPPRPRCNKLATGTCTQFGAAKSRQSPDTSPIRVMLPLVDVRHSLYAVALAHNLLLPDAIPSILATGAVPEPARIEACPYFEIAERPYGTAKIRFKRSKSTPQRGAASEPTTKFSKPSRRNAATFCRPTASPALFVNIRTPKSAVKPPSLAFRHLASLLRGKRTLACHESPRGFGKNEMTKRTRAFMEAF